MEPFRSGVIQTDLYRDGNIQLAVTPAIDNSHGSSADLLKYLVPGKERRSFCRGQAAIPCFSECFLHTLFPTIQDKGIFERVQMIIICSSKGADYISVLCAL
jgi:hypothetical protein